MKLLHISDLHLGKRLHEFSFLDEQANILDQILLIIENENIDAVLIAGDVYDKSVPSAEAVNLFDGFLSRLSKNKIETFIISGNHDSPERIAFGSSIMKNSGIHLSPVYNGEIEKNVLTDEFGEVCIYMLPFIKPAHVKRFFENEEINSYTDALNVAVSAIKLDKTSRNVLITHQFVTGSSRSDSEESVGGTDNVDKEVFNKFDYVALGHLHKRQFCGTENLHYSGTPLKYSFSEINDEKSATIITLKDKANDKTDIEYKFMPLKPIHDMSEIRGEFLHLIDPTYYLTEKKKDDYLKIALTDENDVPDAMSRLKAIYKNALFLGYDNKRTRANNEIGVVDTATNKTPLELFEEFYYIQNDQNLSLEQKEFMKKLIEELEEEQL